MRPDVGRAMRWSSACFARVVAPVVMPVLGGGEVHAVEATTADEMRKQLDVLAGVDFWQVCSGRGMRGIASRVQCSRTSYETFTLREVTAFGSRETEFRKRLRALSEPRNGWLRPHWTIQAYVTSKEPGSAELVAAAAVLTDDLVVHASAHVGDADGTAGMRNGVWRQTNSFDGSKFLCVSWRSLVEAGATILTNFASKQEVA